MYCIVLNYHRIIDRKEADQEKHSVYRDAFERQMKHIAETGYAVVTPSDLFDPAVSFKKAVLITFDDGNISDYRHAYPLLRQYGLRAVFFIATDRVGTQKHVDWKHLKEMQANGMIIQSHSKSHCFLTDLKPKALTTELHESKKIIEAHMGNQVDCISIPHGFVSKRVLRTAQALGYRGIFTSCPGLTARQKGPFGIIGRNAVVRTTDFGSFSLLMSAGPAYFGGQIRRYKMKQIVRAVIGSKNYYKVYASVKKYKTS